MQNERNWEKLTGTSLRLVPVGVLKQAPTRLRALVRPVPQHYRGPLQRTPATSAAMSRLYDQIHYVICITAPDSP